MKKIFFLALGMAGLYFSVLSSGGHGGTLLAIKKVPAKAIERPLPFRLMPRLQMTDFWINDINGTVRIGARNFGGPMRESAKIRLSMGNVPVREMDWYKDKDSWSYTVNIFDNANPPALRSCSWGKSDYEIEVRILSTENQAAAADQFRRGAFHSRQDLAAKGFTTDPLGRVSISVQNQGTCQSQTWSFRYYLMGALVETSPTLGALMPGQWASALLQNQPPARARFGGLFKLEVIPANPVCERDAVNNIYETRGIGGVYNVIISDIRFLGEAEWRLSLSKESGEYYHLVFSLKNLDNRNVPNGMIHYQVFIDGVSVYENGCMSQMSPNEEILYMIQYPYNSPVLPSGSHKVKVVCDLCFRPLEKMMTRPPLKVIDKKNRR